MRALSNGLQAVWDAVSGRGYMQRNGLGHIEDYERFGHYEHLQRVQTRLANVQRFHGIRDFLRSDYDPYIKNAVPAYAASPVWRKAAGVGGVVAGIGLYVYHRMAVGDTLVSSFSMASPVHGLAYIFSGVTGALNLHARHVVYRAKLDRQTEELQGTNRSAAFSVPKIHEM